MGGGQNLGVKEMVNLLEAEKESTRSGNLEKMDIFTTAHKILQ